MSSLAAAAAVRAVEAGRGRGEEEVAEGAVSQLLDGVHQGALGGNSIGEAW